MSNFTDNSQILSGPLVCSFDFTNRCMLKCLHCFNRSGNDLKRDELSDSEVLSIVDDFCKLKLHTFCICGGEALIRKELVLEACRRLSKSCKYVNIVSNGFLITKEVAIQLKNAGISLVQISIDGKDSYSHDYMRGVKGSFDKAIKAIEILDSLNIKINVAFSPTKFNIEEFPLVVKKLSKFKNLLSIRSQPLMLLGRGSYNDIAPTEEQYRKMVKFIENFNFINNYKFIEWGDPIDHIIRYSSSYISNIFMINVKSDGTLLASPYLPFIVGNLKRHSIIEYWEAGLGKVWKIPFVVEISKSQSSISYLGKDENLPKMFFDKNIEFDIIDNDVFSNLNKYTLKNILKERCINEL